MTGFTVELESCRRIQIILLKLSKRVDNVLIYLSGEIEGGVTEMEWDDIEELFPRLCRAGALDARKLDLASHVSAIYKASVLVHLLPLHVACLSLQTMIF